MVTNILNTLLFSCVFSKRDEQRNNKNNENEISILKISKVASAEYEPFLNISYTLLAMGREDNGKAMSNMNVRFNFPKIDFSLSERKNISKFLFIHLKTIGLTLLVNGMDNKLKL